MSSSTLHILAMVFMLIDHIGAVLYPQHILLRCIGRLAYPIYAFMIVQGVKHTKDIKHYFLRMLGFALVAEIPFNLMLSHYYLDASHQNVLWTFIIAILCICVLNYLKDTGIYYFLAVPLVCCLGYELGVLFKTDYKGAGVLMVLVFYLFEEKTPINYFVQSLLLYLINGQLMNSYLIRFFGIITPIQTIAVLSLLLIWLYNGKKGIKSKTFQYFCYAFYPLHMLILYLI